MDDAFYGRRVERIKIELLNSNDVSLGILGRSLGGSIDYSQGREVRGGGSLDITLSRDVNWEAARIKISRAVVRDNGEEVWFGCGVFIPQAGDEDWTAEGATMSLNLLDKTALLKEPTPYTFSLGVGVNVTQAIRDIFTSLGETRVNITESNNTLSTPMTWDPRTTWLRIINDLLGTINYFSVWADGDGVFRADPYRRPADRPEVFPFRNDRRSITLPDFKVLQEPSSVPNRVIAYSRVEGEEEQLVSIATNESATNPYSYQNRGEKWRTETLEDVDVTTQEALDEYAIRTLIDRTSVARGVSFDHGWLPLAINDVVSWYNSRADMDIKGVVVEYKIPLEEGSLMSTRVTEVIDL